MLGQCQGQGHGQGQGQGQDQGHGHHILEQEQSRDDVLCTKDPC